MRIGICKHTRIQINSHAPFLREDEQQNKRVNQERSLCSIQDKDQTLKKSDICPGDLEYNQLGLKKGDGGMAWRLPTGKKILLNLFVISYFNIRKNISKCLIDLLKPLGKNGK